MEDEKIIREYQILASQLEALKVQMEIIESSLEELEKTKVSLDEIEKIREEKKGGKAEVLIPLGSGSFIRGSIENPDKILLSIGSGFAVEKSVGEAVGFIKSKIDELRKAKNEREKELLEVTEKLEKISPKVREIIERLEKSEKSEQS